MRNEQSILTSWGRDLRTLRESLRLTCADAAKLLDPPIGASTWASRERHASEDAIAPMVAVLMAHKADQDAIKGAQRELLREDTPEPEKLKPCPLCGADADWHEYDTPGEYGVICCAPGSERCPMMMDGPITEATWQALPRNTPAPDDGEGGDFCEWARAKHLPHHEDMSRNAVNLAAREWHRAQCETCDEGKRRDELLRLSKDARQWLEAGNMQKARADDLKRSLVGLSTQHHTACQERDDALTRAELAEALLAESETEPRITVGDLERVRIEAEAKWSAPAYRAVVEARNEALAEVAALQHDLNKANQELAEWRDCATSESPWQSAALIALDGRVTALEESQ